MSPDLSRRQLLASGVGVAALGGASTRVDIGSIESWTPSRGTWSHDHYDLRNRAANPHAEPPTDPEVAWRARPVEKVQSIVVGPERVYVGGEIHAGGQGVAALDREQGRVEWTASVGGATLALRRGTLYAGDSRGKSIGLTALDAVTGERRWRSSVGDVKSVAVADGTVFAGGNPDLAALDADSGRVRWTGDGSHETYPAIAEGSLFTTAYDVRRYRPRRVSDVLTGGPPPKDWQGEAGERTFRPVVAEGRVLVGSGNFFYEPEGGALSAFDVASGERQWTAVEVPDAESLVVVGSPAVRNGRCFSSLRRGEDSERYHAVVAHSLSDGTERWRVETGDWVSAVAVGDETVLVGTSGDDDTPGEARNRLLGFTLDGRERWSFDAGSAVRSVAAVGGTVFVGTENVPENGRNGVLYALR
ncbi:outer membrane protein assembly factor BamB family protein [Halorussus pelagicus]|uniref:outer membrane protein assembly factor BamB family protein n=1 Tax=Halorussus pelagicus TaxID=2505977 RepID=UPI000FFCB00A|nr:PQQ-binding-like beta-propeller repeat protein [Halorussus pelagicus]